MGYLSTTISRQVRTNQPGVHPRLEEVVRRHLQHPWQAPLHSSTVEAFGKLEKIVGKTTSNGIIIDSGCGTGFSTRLISEVFPDSLVIGIDRSADRLARTQSPSSKIRTDFRTTMLRHEDQVIWWRAELTTAWRLMQAAGWTLQRHFLLYPNPYPKYRHLARRWHGHPVFPQLLDLGGVLEMRTNWSTYAQEFALAAGWVTGEPIVAEPVLQAVVTSPFEQKYARSGHSLYRVRTPGESTTISSN